MEGPRNKLLSPSVLLVKKTKQSNVQRALETRRMREMRHRWGLTVEMLQKGQEQEGCHKRHGG